MSRNKRWSKKMRRKERRLWMGRVLHGIGVFHARSKENAQELERALEGFVAFAKDANAAQPRQVFVPGGRDQLGRPVPPRMIDFREDGSIVV